MSKKKFKCHSCNKENKYDSESDFSGYRYGGYNILSGEIGFDKISMQEFAPKRIAVECKHCGEKNMITVNG